MEKKVNCPTCNKQIIWHQQATYRPFCSQRCHSIDLGEWASESYRVASEAIDPLEVDLANMSALHRLD